MKTFLAAAAVLALSATFAHAGCDWHNKTASAGVDATITTASVKTTAKQSRIPAATDEVVIKQDSEAPPTAE